MKVGQKVRVKKSIRFVVSMNGIQGALKRYVKNGQQLEIKAIAADYVIVGIPTRQWRGSLADYRDSAARLKIKPENLELV